MATKPMIVATIVGSLLVALSTTLDQYQFLGLPLEATRWIGYLYVALIHLAPALVYLLIYRHTSSFSSRLTISLLPTLGWWLSELIMRMRWNSFVEALWLLVSPFFLFQLAIVLTALGITHLAVLAVLKQKPQVISTAAYIIVTFAVAASAPASISLFLIGYQSTFQADLLPSPKQFPGRLDPETITGNTSTLPNIVFILSDDHRHDFSGYAGHPFIETPNIDELAEQGVVFDRAYVSTSLCSPSRASFLTGVSPYQHGVWNNFTPWSEQNRTFFEYLKAAGYSTAFIGKWHMPGNELPDIAGLDHFVSFTNVGGQGVYKWNPMIVNGIEVPSRTRYIATELTDYATEWLEQQEAPFVLYLSHKSVHAGFQPDEPDAGIYATQEVDLPEESHLWSAHTKNQYVHLNGAPLDDSIRRYGEAIHSMDREIGRLLDRLAELNLSDSTIVIYTSDNGYQWGEHELTDKRWAYETSIRVPFVMRLPDGDHRGTRNSRLIANVDVAATFLDAAGLEPPDYMEGQSLIRLLNDPAIDWRETFLYSYFFEPPYPTPTSFALISERFKLIETDWQGFELYDLHNDPEEQNNLAKSQQFAETLADLAAQLQREKQISSGQAAAKR